MIIPKMGTIATSVLWVRDSAGTRAPRRRRSGYALNGARPHYRQDHEAPRGRVTFRESAAGPASRNRAQHSEEDLMCRNIKTLANFEPPATEEEIRSVDEVTAVARRLID